MIRIPRIPRFAVSAVVGAIVLVACGSGVDDSTRTEEVDATTYFTALSEAYSANDYYGVLDFYAPDAFQERWRGAVRGGALVRDLLRWNSGDLGHEVVDVHLGSGGALNLIRWDKGGGLSTIISTIGDGRIAGEIAFDHGAWLEAGLRTSPEVVSAYESLYMAYARAWSEGDDEALRNLYSSDAALRDTLQIPRVTGLDAIVESRPASGTLDGFEAAQEVNGVPIKGLAVFLGPADFGIDPGRAVGLYTVTDPDDCQRQIAVAWEVVDGEIVREERFEGIEGLAVCQASLAADGWWMGLGLPSPSDQVATGVLTTGGGYELEIFNGTPRLEALLATGFDRFRAAGLPEPHFDRATFEPSRRCQDRSGRLIQDGDGRDLFLCFFESDVCGGGLQCEQPLQSIRLAVLHELAHAWIIDNVDTDIRKEFMGAAGLVEWDGDDVPWSKRGVEYAAEVLAWGLLEEAASMARIGRPPCEGLHTSFRLLTGEEPLRADAECGS